MDFLNNIEGVWCSVRFSLFLLYRNYKRLRQFEEILKMLHEFEEIEISRQCCCRSDWEKQGGKLLRFLSGFRLRIRPLGRTVEYRHQ
jgi:hypothetical protein